MKTWIIKNLNGRYFCGFGPYNQTLWNPHIEDAFRFESEKAAQRLAHQIGGKVTT